MLYEKEMFHYLLLHFPIALFSTGYLFDVLSFYKNNHTLYTFSLWNIGMGIFWGILSIISGFITDWSLYGHMKNPLPIWTTHGSHMIASIVIFLFLFIIKHMESINRVKISKINILILHTFILVFFIHGAHVGAKLADRL